MSAVMSPDPVSRQSPGRDPVSRQSVAEHEQELVPGIPGRLPAGETLLWQGAPQWWSLARSMHVRELAVYFLGLVGIRAITAWTGDVAAEFATVAELLAVSATVLGMVCLFAWMAARTTIYSITDRRLVVRYGVALSKAVNIPFAVVTNLAWRRHADGTGDLCLQLDRSARVPYVMLWPHVRPWRFSPSQPMLRAVPDAAVVAQGLSRALAAATGGQIEAVATVPARKRGGLEPSGAVTA